MKTRSRIGGPISFALFIPVYLAVFILFGCTDAGERTSGLSNSPSPALQNPYNIEGLAVFPDGDDELVNNFCEERADKFGLSGFRSKKIAPEDIMIRVCIGVNTPRDKLLFIEKIDGKISGTLVSVSDAADLKLEETSFNEERLVDPDLWKWIEGSDISEYEPNQKHCTADPANDSVLLIVEIRKGDAYHLRTAAEYCCVANNDLNMVSRFVSELGRKISVELFECLVSPERQSTTSARQY